MKLSLFFANVMRGIFAICLAASVVSVCGQDSESQPGLALTWQVGEAKAKTITPNIWLYVPAGQPPSPFVPSGRFTATFEGFVNIDLRGDYSFHATGKGGVKLEVNNAVLLDLKGIGGVAQAKTKAVRLNKGANAIKVTYSSPSKGDAALRVFWSERPDAPLPHEPIRSGQLTHLASLQLTQAVMVEKGRELFIKHRCIRCHSSEGSVIPEFEMSGPDFSAIGDRLNRTWLSSWILDPSAHRKDARMPKVLHGETAASEAAVIATYLSTLKRSEGKADANFPVADLEAGAELVRELNCVGCHSLPGDSAAQGDKLSLAHLNEKYKKGELVDFLLEPNRHYDWTRMPKFKLQPVEAWNISQWLRSQSRPHEEPAIKIAAEEIDQGKRLVGSKGCINCHSHEQENMFKAPDLVSLASAKWNEACLAEKSDGESPVFRLTMDERAALRAFAATDRKSLHRHDPAEFTRRQIKVLNCNACHGELEGFTKLDMIGHKLKTEWVESILSGSIKQKSRPWLKQRMPAFPARARELAHGLALGHGYPAITAAEARPVDVNMAKIGRDLVGVDGGFSCVACHGVKNRQPLQVFEAQGINFAQVNDRLRPDYFLRWMLDPLRVDSQTRMPDYFDEAARSVLVDVLEGDAKKQIEAIRQYLRQGNDMKIPAMQ